MSVQDSAINIKEYTRPPDIYPLKVACSSKFSWSTNLESKLIDIFVLVNTVHFGSLQPFTVLKIDNVHAAQKRCVCGCNLKKGRGRPKGTTRINGYGVSTSGGRPVGTTAEDGYGVSPGRPVGTRAEEEYGVSLGRPACGYHSRVGVRC